jgi:RecJ-like exonuclease
MTKQVSSNRCAVCGGKGFHWKPGKIISKRDGSELANIYSYGDKCETCNGTGEAGLVMLSRKFAYFAIGLTVLAFVYHFVSFISR